jgi:hypothetical protein
MKEQRRHQRIRFSSLPVVQIGQLGAAGSGAIENLSIDGLVLRTDFLLKIGEAFGCEFTLFDSPRIDFSAVVVSRIGDLYNARFHAGPLSEWLIHEAIDNALAAGVASILSINDVRGRKVMRVAGGLNATLGNDFMHGLVKMGVDELDLSEVVRVDGMGIELCRIAVEDYKVGIVNPSACVVAAMAA